MRPARALLLVLAAAAAAAPETDPAGVEVIDGGLAKLPCELAPDDGSEDKVVTVLWYRGRAVAPFYRYDTRKVPPHWTDPELGDRVFLQVTDDGRATLTLGTATVADDDAYRCRVKFAHSPEKTSEVNLTVVGEHLDL